MSGLNYNPEIIRCKDGQSVMRNNTGNFWRTGFILAYPRGYMHFRWFREARICRIFIRRYWHNDNQYLSQAIDEIHNYDIRGEHIPIGRVKYLEEQVQKWRSERVPNIQP